MCDALLYIYIYIMNSRVKIWDESAPLIITNKYQVPFCITEIKRTIIWALKKSSWIEVYELFSMLMLIFTIYNFFDGIRWSRNHTRSKRRYCCFIPMWAIQQQGKCFENWEHNLYLILLSRVLYLRIILFIIWIPSKRSSQDFLTNSSKLRARHCSLQKNRFLLYRFYIINHNEQYIVGGNAYHINLYQNQTHEYKESKCEMLWKNCLF